MRLSILIVSVVVMISSCSSKKIGLQVEQISEYDSDRGVRLILIAEYSNKLNDTACFSFGQVGELSRYRSKEVNSRMGLRYEDRVINLITPDFCLAPGEVKSVKFFSVYLDDFDCSVLSKNDKNKILDSEHSYLMSIDCSRLEVYCDQEIKVIDRGNVP